jgi:hypothetical protein
VLQKRGFFSLSVSGVADTWWVSLSVSGVKKIEMPTPDI